MPVIGAGLRVGHLRLSGEVPREATGGAKQEGEDTALNRRLHCEQRI